MKRDEEIKALLTFIQETHAPVIQYDEKRIKFVFSIKVIINHRRVFGYQSFCRIYSGVSDIISIRYCFDGIWRILYSRIYMDTPTIKHYFS